MTDCYSDQFIGYLKNSDLDGLQSIPKSDLHNHFVLGGSREYIFQKTGIRIPFMSGRLESMQEMHDWNNQYLGQQFNRTEMRKLLIEATLFQAKADGVTLLEIGEDVWANEVYYNGDVSCLIGTFKSVQREIAPDINLRLQIGLSRHCPIDCLEKWLEPFWEYSEFFSIDLYGDEMAQPISLFESIYKKAKEHGLRLKAHIGEWGSAVDIIEGIKTLGLDEVQHGISAAYSQTVIRFLADNHIRLNICPTSNVKLGRVNSLEEHPVGMLYRAGVDVTINSDDVLMFDSDVTKEYLRLFKAGVLSAEELDEIRVNGLRRI